MGKPKKVTKLFLLAHKKLRKNKYKVFLFGGVFFSWSLIAISLATHFLGSEKEKSVLSATTIISPAVEIQITIPPISTPTIPPSPVPTTAPTKKVTPTNSPTPTLIASDTSQYTAEKINDVTWKVSNLQNDDKMASPQEIVNAINSYRWGRGLSSLSTDSYLSSYAQERANLFAGNENLDSHAGFRSFMDNGGFDAAGFNSLGENSAYLSGNMNGDKIVRNLFGADPSHDSNQLDNWTHVGVGVNGNAVNVNFGKGKK